MSAPLPTVADVERDLKELADAIGEMVAKPRSLTAQTMLGSAVKKVATSGARLARAVTEGAARERDLIARLQAAEARYQARQTELLAACSAEVERRRRAERQLTDLMPAEPAADVIDVVTRAHMKALGFHDSEIAVQGAISAFRRDGIRMIRDIAVGGYTICSTAGFDIVPKPGVVRTP